MSEILSIISLMIACVAAAWTVYEKILLKPRSKVAAQISFVKSGDYESDAMVEITITNLGPGKIIIESIFGIKKFLFGGIRKKNKYAFIMQDYTNIYNQKMPFEIDQYRKMTQLLPFTKGCLINGDLTRIGFKDSINRIHYISKRNMKSLVYEYTKKFKIE